MDVKPINSLDYIKINLASPTQIKKWGMRSLPDGQVVGEVLNSRTLHYRSLKPEWGGLFCEKIFGPVKSWQCACGKYNGSFYDGLVCESCKVEIVDSKIRRTRLAYIELNSPVTHIWYLKGRPSKIGRLLNMKIKDLEGLVYFYQYVFLKSGTSYKPFIGAEAVKLLLNRFNLRFESSRLRSYIPDKIVYSELIEDERREFDKLFRKIRIIEQLIATGCHPSWMVIDVMPVLPPDLRPMVELSGNTIATTDLTELYRRLISRNNRLKELNKISAPDSLIHTEKRLIQDAVDTIIQNGKRQSVENPNNKAPYKSLSDIISGKYGRLRRNLLGKRVDYSGRSVIISGPELYLNQCALPREMALELFRPFILHQLFSRKVVTNFKAAQIAIRLYQDPMPKLLLQVMKGHPVLLNRAPTLHRLGIQAFEPLLTEGKAIKLHPLVCAGFNADFDGDQMAVHVPLSLEAQSEAFILLNPTQTFLSPATGEPVLIPSQDMIIGCYYLTVNNPLMQDLLKQDCHFYSARDVLLAYQQERIGLHQFIWLRYDSNLVGRFPSVGKEFFFKNRKCIVSPFLKIKKTTEGKTLYSYIRTTPGRVLLNSCFEPLFEPLMIDSIDL